MQKLLLTLGAKIKETFLAFETDFVNTFSTPAPFIPDGEMMYFCPIQDIESCVGKQVLIQRIDKDPESDKPWPPVKAKVQEVNGDWARLLTDDERRFWIRMSDFSLLEVF
jgi:hypothetical protein